MRAVQSLYVALNPISWQNQQCASDADTFSGEVISKIEVSGIRCHRAGYFRTFGPSFLLAGVPSELRVPFLGLPGSTSVSRKPYINSDIHLFWTINCPVLAILIKTLFFETLQKIVCASVALSQLSNTHIGKLTCGKATQNVRQEHSSESISRSLLIYCTITDTFFMPPLISISSMVCLKSAFIC